MSATEQTSCKSDFQLVSFKMIKYSLAAIKELLNQAEDQLGFSLQECS